MCYISNSQQTATFALHSVKWPVSKREMENVYCAVRTRSLTLWRLTTYICHTAQLTSRSCILNIHSTNILTEYFKHAAHSPFFFSLQDAVYFIMLSFFGSCNIHILNTECAKILKKIPTPKGQLKQTSFLP